MVDSLVERLNKLKLSNIMATAQVIEAPSERQINYQLLRLYVDTIPKFNGDPGTLEIFIEHCNFLIATYTNVSDANDPINGFLIRAVISKLSGNALVLIGSRPEIRTWDGLRSLLRLSFGDQRNIDCLVQEMLMAKPNRNETSLQFGQKVQKLRSAIASKLISLNLPLLERNFKLANYDELALKTFIRGLSGRTQDMVRLRNPGNLELAISIVLEEENFTLYQKQNYTATPTASYNKVPVQNRPPIVHRPNYQTFSQNFVRQPPFLPSSYVQQQIPSQFLKPQFPKPQFPSQPIDVQPSQSQATPQKFLTNKQVFGPPKNVFKPTGNIPPRQYEPMSTTSRNTTVQRSQNFHNPNYFRSTGPRNFISEELHHLNEISEDCYTANNPEDQELENQFNYSQIYDQDPPSIENSPYTEFPEHQNPEFDYYTETNPNENFTQALPPNPPK